MASRPDHLKAPLRSEFERLKTYPMKWSLGYNKGDLAKDGFFCITTASVSAKVQCFACSLRLSVKHQVQTQTIRELHRELSPMCLMNLASGEDIINIPLFHTYIYKFEINRLYSFLVADFHWPVDINDLARTGFYYDPVKKSTRCCYCPLQIGTWREGDTGKGEHLKYSSQCAFNKDAASVENIKFGEENSSEAKKIIDTVLLEKSYASGQTTGTSSRIAMVLEEPKHARFDNLEARVESFNIIWPASMKQRPVELADAGFFCVGRGDRVACYQCGKGLKFWGAQDQPWNEHAYWYPDCALVNAVKGYDFIRKMQNLRARGTKTSTIEPVENPEDPENDTCELAEDPMEIGVDAASRTCKVCLNRELGIVFLPCAHMATCSDCAPQLKHCPICRCEFTAYVRSIIT